MVSTRRVGLCALHPQTKLKWKRLCSTCGDNRHNRIKWHQWCTLGEMVERGDKEQGQLVNGILKLSQSVHPVWRSKWNVKVGKEKCMQNFHRFVLDS